MEELDLDVLALNISKYEFTKAKIYWLGCTFTANGTATLIIKTEAIVKLDNLKNTHKNKPKPTPMDTHKQMVTSATQTDEVLNKVQGWLPLSTWKPSLHSSNLSP